MSKVNRGLVFLAVILLAGFVGCAPEDQKISKAAPVKIKKADLSLKFTEASTTVYKSVIEKDKSVEFEGKISKGGQLKGGHTGRKVEMVFSQLIQSVDPTGVANAKITVKELKVFSQEKSKALLDFDSSRPQDKNNKLTKVIGKSYWIKLSPAGEVLAVSEAANLAKIFKGTSATDQAGAFIFSTDEIKQRHGIVGFKSAKGKSMAVGDTWKDKQNFSFGMVGEHNFEKVYTLKSIKGTTKKADALISMEAIPAADKTGKEIDFSKMFDSEDHYTGEIHFDVIKNQVSSYYEKLNSKVVIVDPTFKGEGQPDVIRMGILHYYSLKEID